MGATESVNDIIKQMEEANTVKYLMNKYKDNLYFVCKGYSYNLTDLEKVLEQYSYITFGHDVETKMGIVNEEKDGLLMLLNVILNEVSSRRYK